MPGIISMKSAAVNREAVLAREIEHLKRRVIWCERAGADSSRQVSFLYRAADRFGRKIITHSFCRGEIGSHGCATGCCCRCRPDVFAAESQLLDLLPQRNDDSGYCPFFNLARKNCGIYGVRPFACRVYFNLGATAHYCRNPNDTTLQLFDSLKPHLARVLGSYQGGYGVAAANSVQSGMDTDV
ncbi:YkgJ family cysteine cluster protein [Geobacter pelophilus]|uniref:YkgJ family cysteine cluster protein n=1 Tax=Geoanaerobacter pelophilus TaxID=60036 RepID=A0AAW4L2E0_9BACT|nr:YkgJ family cysteine cluster protein [Geoanaerobacter pelophilus]MBT0663665.1 YkgJ family cysteine cluster protein [Geoanaerobacter pelophilus]